MEIKLDKSKVYSLEDLTSEEYKKLVNEIDNTVNQRYSYLYNRVFSNILRNDVVLTNAKELFYTLKNLQIDCRELSEEQIKEMFDVYVNNGYEILYSYSYASEICYESEYFFLKCENSEVYVGVRDEAKTTITYEKFMELFGDKGIEEINGKPKHYSKGIDTFNPQPHYNNENGSLYKIANDLGLNHWEFDVFKRLVRCRKKNQFKEDLQKIKDTIDIYLNEYSE